jgi:hypothetical protein
LKDCLNLQVAGLKMGRLSIVKSGPFHLKKSPAFESDAGGGLSHETVHVRISVEPMETTGCMIARISIFIRVAGHVDRAMMEHYSHVGMAANRDALDKLEP